MTTSKIIVAVIIMLSVIGCGDNSNVVLVKNDWKRIDPKIYSTMDDVTLLKRWAEIDYNGNVKKDMESKGGAEAMLAKVGGKIEEKGRRCFVNLILLHDALEGMGASHAVVTAAMECASSSYDFKNKMSVAKLTELLPGLAEIYGLLAGINTPPQDLAEWLVDAYIETPEDANEIRETVKRYRAVRDVLIAAGISRGDAEAGLARFVFVHGSGLDENDFSRNEDIFSKIKYEHLESLISDCRELRRYLSSIKEASDKDIVEPLVIYLATPADERAEGLLQIKTYIKTFVKERKKRGDFVAAIVANDAAGRTIKDVSVENELRLSVQNDFASKKPVLDLCKYVAFLEKEPKITIEQIEAFRGSKDRTTRYVAFYEAMTSAGISGDVAMSELARFVFHDSKKANKTEVAYDYTYAGDVRSLNTACRSIRKTLSKGGVPDARIVRYLVGFLVASPDDRQKLEKDCPAFVQMYRVVSDAVREIVTEAEDAEMIFTDDGLYGEIHEECKRRRLALVPCSMMSSEFSRETYMEKMTNGVAVAQMGFELFKRNGIQPSYSGFSGFLYRHGRMSDSVRMKGIEFANKLARRILDLQEKKVVDSLKDDEMRSKFLFVQWRISRIAVMRAEQEHRLGLIEQSKRSKEIADKLDECNVSLQRILQGMAKAREKMGKSLSAKEILQVALSRADFELAQNSARNILKTTPDDPNANFAMGMWHYQHERWGEAEKHLLRCTIKRPKEVAVLNNLAIVYLKQKRLEEARTYARKALALMPDSANVKDTLGQVEKAIEDKRR